MAGFPVPIALFVFKRRDSVLRIIERIRPIRPVRLYVLGDAARTPEEETLVSRCRQAVLQAIDWECEVITNFATVNRGVYGNIALGARWVFEREQEAIFLEDDNLPQTTFFPFCQELLGRYRDDLRILWICGTNYLEKYEPEDGASYVFTKHLLPCGWASWSHKFMRFYDFTFSTLNDVSLRKVRASYESKPLFWQQSRAWRIEMERARAGLQYLSWDFHMCWSIRANSLWGISPKYNQIENIGVDNLSEHGHSSMSKTMTKRFCGIRSYPMPTELAHPRLVVADTEYEKRTRMIIQFPLTLRLRVIAGDLVRRLFGIPCWVSPLNVLKSFVHRLHRGDDDVHPT